MHSRAFELRSAAVALDVTVSSTVSKKKNKECFANVYLVAVSQLEL